MVDLNPNISIISIITLNPNSIRTSIKRKIIKLDKNKTGLYIDMLLLRNIL